MTKYQVDIKEGFCQWCLKTLKKENSLQELVCVECYRLLVRAGITDEEIFKTKEKS